MILGAEPTIIIIFNKIKKEIKKIGHSAQNVYVNFNKVKVLNKEIVPLSLPMYMRDVTMHLKSIAKGKNRTLSRGAFI